MPFLRTPPANDSDDTESITTSIEDREAEEYRVWAADQEFMEKGFDGRNATSFLPSGCNNREDELRTYLEHF